MRRRTRLAKLTLAFGLAALGCTRTSSDQASQDQSKQDREPPPLVHERPAPPQPRPTPPSLPEDWGRDILSTKLEIDVDTRRGRAQIELAPSASEAASLEIGDLTIAEVRDASGRALRFEDLGGQLDVEVPATTEPLVIEIDYRFYWHDDRVGAMRSGSTLVWPYNCGNLFPCKSDPADGLGLELKLTGFDPELTALYPRAITSEAPSYQLAWAIGDYQRLDLGQTQAGTHVSVWYLPGNEAEASEGTKSLRAAFDWLEQTYGEYRFGDEVGSVEVAGLGYAGMEHHPFWHLDTSAMDAAEVHIHEAAHGWFGAGVRVACWEDLVLSEGTTTYLTARALEAAEGSADADALWKDYEDQLRSEGTLRATSVARPEGCGATDMLDFYSGLLYVKGAFFCRALERRVGREALDRALAAAYARYQGRAASLQDVLDVIEISTGYDPDACAATWLRSTELPPDIHAPCP